MQELLKKYKTTKAVSDKMPVMQIDVESINVDIILDKLFRFNVGEFTDIYGTTEIKLMYKGGMIPLIPPEFELRVRGLNTIEFSMFYPTGYLVWNKLIQYDTESAGITYKACAMTNSENIPFIKIWRSK